MVAFATLFLGLVLGPQVVEVAVDGAVARLEIHLDGEAVAARGEPPWRFPIDFGSSYEPHVMEAVAFDAGGEELARAEQWINLPRREAEAEIVIGGGSNGTGVFARVLWESQLEAMPDEVLATFDGQPLEVADPERIALPRHDPRELHLLQVELRFRGDYSAVVEKAFGGIFTDEVETRLTAVPIALPRGARAPRAADLRDRFVDTRGRPLEVVAVDEGPAHLIVVRDASAQAALDELVALRDHRPIVYREGNDELPMSPAARLRLGGRLRKNQLTRLLYPVTEELAGHRALQEQFPTSRFFRPSDGGLAWLMTGERREIDPARQRLAEAVAVAGMAAARHDRRRAVLLVLGRGSPDGSRIRPEQARRYLAALHVPLEVWALDDDRPSGPWGPQRLIRSLSGLHAASRELGRSLERQRIVWLAGRHLPSGIALSEPAGFTLAD